MKLSFTEEGYKSLAFLRADGILCDVTLRGKSNRNHPILAHKVVLAAQSAYFKVMFTTAMLESQQKDIVIENIEAKVLQKIVDYCYTGEIRLTPSDIEDLLDAAHMLGLFDLQEQCFQFLQNNLDGSNCYGVAHLAEKYSCKEVRKVAEDFALKNFRYVMNSVEFIDLPYDNVLKLVSNNQLHVVCESEVYVAVMKWVKHKPDERVDHLKDLLAYVRFPLLTRKFLIDHVTKEELIIGDKACRKYLYDALDYHLVPERRSMIEQHRNSSPRCKGTNSIYVIGGESKYLFG